MDLFESIRQGDADTVKKMLSENPQLTEQRDPRGFPPLVLSSYNEQLEITQHLLDAGADIDAQDAGGNTALMGVCFKGYPHIAELLIDRGANVNKQGANGATALMYTAMFGQNEIAELLLQHGADKSIQDQRGNTAIDHARMQGAPGMVELLSD